MSDITPLKASPTSSSSIETVSSEYRKTEWWWRWGSQSPKEPRTADPSESFILTEKRNRKQSRRFPEPELYPGGADTDAQKRMRLAGSYPDNRISKHKTLCGLEAEVRRFFVSKIWKLLTRKFLDIVQVLFE